MVVGYAICTVSVMPLRSEPSHRSEQVSQLLFGERMEVTEQLPHGWLKIVGEWDGYEGYVKSSQVAQLGYKEYRRPLLSLSASWTNKIGTEDGLFPLSPGSSLFLMKKKAMKWGNKQFQFKGRRHALRNVTPDPGTITKMSMLFMGAPYQWGGRSLMGIDCSGLSQNVYKLLDQPLPRDAWQQAETGSTVHFLQEARCGDLAFFDNEEGRINHVGILLDGQTIVHATETSGKVVIDAIDTGGIISKSMKQRTHNLRLIKRILPQWSDSSI